MFSVLIYIVLVIFVVLRYANQGKAKGAGKKGADAQKGAPVPPAGGARPRGAAGRAFGPLATDGHRVPRDQDISCRRFGHDHEEFDAPRYIPHTDPEDGFIVLNGVKMRLSEADSYEDRI